MGFVSSTIVYACQDGAVSVGAWLSAAGAAGFVAVVAGAEIEAALTLDFTDAAHGLTTTLHLTSEAECSSCNGSGARAGTSPKQCPQCRGRGVVEDNQGPFAFSSPCPRCNGRTVVIETPCIGCRGTGVEMRAREVNVRIPGGVDDAQRKRKRALVVLDDSATTTLWALLR